MNVCFEGSTEEGWVCKLKFPESAHPTHVFEGAKGATMDDAYGNLLEALVLECVEMREIVALVRA